jgi:hypothetical protein
LRHTTYRSHPFFHLLLFVIAIYRKRKERARAMNSALRPLWLSSVLLGAAPLGFAPCQKASLAYGLAFFAVVGVYCPAISMSIHVREIPEFIANKDSRATTVSVLNSAFSMLTVVVAVLVFIYINSNVEGLAAVQRDVREICAELGVDIEKRVEANVKWFVRCFWPLLFFWMCKELWVYGDNTLFYTGFEEGVSIIGRAAQVLVEMQFKIHVFMQKWIFEEINAKIHVIKYFQHNNQFETFQFCGSI